MTLKQIAERIAYALGNPFDNVLLNNLRFSIGAYRAMFIRRDMATNGLSDEYLQRFSIPLIRVDKADNCDFTLDCIILRSAKRVPKPVRMKNDVLFKLVSTPDGRTMDYSEYEEVPLRCSNRFTSGAPIYNYTNGYIYVFNINKLKKLTIQAAFVDPYAINECTSTNDCLTDDREYPVPDDFVPDIIRSILSGEFKILEPGAGGEVKVEQQPQ